MGIAHLLFSAARRSFAGLSCTTTAVLDVNEGKLTYLTTQNAATTEVPYVAASVEDDVERTGRREEEEAPDDDLAAIVIQAYFRGHLARRAYRALRSLVKVQAVVRGVLARRQAQLAVHCMEALVRLQVRVRARQLLSRSEQEENLK